MSTFVIELFVADGSITWNRFVCQSVDNLGRPCVNVNLFPFILLELGQNGGIKLRKIIVDSGDSGTDRLGELPEVRVGEEGSEGGLAGVKFVLFL